MIPVVKPQPGRFAASVQVDDAGETRKVVLRQHGSPNSPLTVVAGPGTASPPAYVSLPEAVGMAL